MADDYITGHKPKETYQQLISRVNSNSFFVKDFGPKKRSKKRTKVEAAIDELSNEDRALLVKLLEGTAVRIQVKGEPYIAEKVDGGWRLQREGSEARFVTVNPLACSCPQNRLAGLHCKHMSAVEALL